MAEGREQLQREDGQEELIMTDARTYPPGFGDRTAFQMLERAAALAPDREALVAPDGRITFAGLRESVERLAGSFAAAGVTRHMPVALCLGNSIQWVACFLALARIGAVAVPVNTRLKTDEIAFILRDAEVTFAVFADRVLSSDFAAMLPAIREAAPALETVIMTGARCEDTVTWQKFSSVSGDLPEGPAPEDMLLVQYTSGTTSFPKAVPLTHGQMLTNGFISGQRLGLRSGDRIHSARPFFHVAGSTLSILSCLQHLVTLVTMARFEPAEALAQMEAEECSHFAGNGTMASMILDHPDRPKRTLRLRGSWLAADPGTVERVIRELGARETVTGYGLSESSPNVAQSAWWEPEHIRIDGLMAPQPGVDVRIGGKSLDEPCEGEIEVRGWPVMSGYLRRPEATAETLVDGWLKTGDLGRGPGDGRFAFIGRLKELIRVGGENVAPAEIEALFCSRPDVGMAAAVPLPDERLGEVPVIFCVSETDADELKKWAAERLAGFKAPRHVWCVPDADALGLTASGKVRKNELKERAIELAKTST
jgi:fatty-acyl-CoA synthase